MLKKLLGLLFFFIIPCSSSASGLYVSDKFSLSLKGYYKNLNFVSKRAATGSTMGAELNRIRTEWDAKIGKTFSTKVIWDNELIAGDYVNSEEFAARQTQRNLPYLNMDYELVRKTDFFYGQSFYRAYGQIDTGPVQLTVGRQKIGWGVMRLFSPVDLFTRLPIFDIEKEEKVGTTAANLTLSLSPSLKINPVYAFHPDFDQTRLGGRITKTIGRFDLSALGGKFLTDEIFGFDFTGDIKKAGVRGEVIYDRTETGGDFVQFAGGIDYGFENSFYTALEYFHNGRGISNAVQIQTVHPNFLGLNLKYDLSPLWTVAAETVVDLNGGSVFLFPETRYSLFEWAEIAVGGQIPVGKSGGEFTTVPNAFYFQTQFFF